MQRNKLEFISERATQNVFNNNKRNNYNNENSYDKINNHNNGRSMFNDWNRNNHNNNSNNKPVQCYKCNGPALCYLVEVTPGAKILIIINNNQ